jgi:hypothetical protein
MVNWFVKTVLVLHSDASKNERPVTCCLYMTSILFCKEKSANNRYGKYELIHCTVYTLSEHILSFNCCVTTKNKF